MSFRDEFLWSQKTYAEWSLGNTTRDGFQGNQERLNALQKQVKSTFEQGIDRLAQNQAASSVALQGELAYQAEKIGEQIDQGSRDVVSAVQQGSASIVSSIQQMSGYLGSELCEVRWAVERQTAVSEKMLEVMLNSLSNESRQYFEQGVKCYETTEFDFAKERFSKALEANRTNHFAYQYLGFVAVAEDNSDEAIRNFDLARKFAETGYYKALAFSHLARSKHALGDDATAVDFAKSATAAHSDTAKFWYESASYNAYLQRAAEAISALREAIERDWTYWAVVSSDTDFDSIRFDVNKLLDQLREREKQKARQAVDNLRRAIDTARKVNAKDEFSEPPSLINDFEKQYRQNNVFVYLDLIPKAQEWHENIFEAAEKSLDDQIREKQNELYKHQSEKNEEIKKLQNSVSSLESKKSQMPAFTWQGGFLAFGAITFAVFFLTVCSMTNERTTGADVIFRVLKNIAVIPLSILLVYNAISYIFGSALPKMQISQRLDSQKNATARSSTTIEDSFHKISEVLNNRINELKNTKERCRARQYL